MLKQKIHNDIKAKGYQYALRKYSGSGFTDYIKGLMNRVAPERDGNKNPPQVREFLKKHGNELVTSLIITRRPIQGSAKKALQYLSLGMLDRVTEDLGYDNLFHLRLIVNHKYAIEKNEVIKASYDGVKSDDESHPVSLNGKQMTIRDMLDKTAQYMGDKYGSYNGKSNNCQVFVLSILNANGLGSDGASKFIKQDTTTIFRRIPGFVEHVANGVTSLAARTNRLLHGEGMQLHKPEQPTDPMHQLKKQALTIVKRSKKSRDCKCRGGDLGGILNSGLGILSKLMGSILS